jgi:hypothetical protein
MALTSVRSVKDLEGPCVLAPERYDPRRESLACSPARGVAVRQLVTPSRRTLTSADGPAQRCLVLDTSDAREGLVGSRKAVQIVGEIGSAKKVVEPGDVIISRLRPYLRQVAFVDAGVRRRDHVLLLCSTEFFVLRPADGRSIAFLVPLLLSEAVQNVLAASQEGGHHPRFQEATLLGLPVPAELLGERDKLSAQVERCVRAFRQSEKGMAALIECAAAVLGGRPAVR